MFKKRIPFCIYFLIGTIFWTNCHNTRDSHFINNEFYEGKFELINGFQIDLLKVDSVATENIDEKIEVDSIGNISTQPAIIKGFPLKYNVIRTIILSRDSDKNSLPPLNKIYFKSQNKGYYWFFMDSAVTERHEILPIDFSVNNWYRIRGLPTIWGDNDYKAFIYVNSDKTFKIFEDYRPGPF